ncbi:MAG TPA: DUF4097 family beta strand repeat-containing protein [Longimicrobiales bacterium]|nr:DUF4097 family beta strand repeat-containing protein [Longimicrobiales bacterium]
MSSAVPTPEPRPSGLRVPLVAAGLLFVLPATTAAQATAEDWCADVGRNQYCEVRQLNAPMTGNSLNIDVGPNGSIRVEGYSGRDVRVTARVQARAGNANAARDLAGDVNVRLAAGELRATGPRTSGRTGWSVSVRVQVPEGMAIEARTTNGSITVASTGAPVNARTTNGTIRLSDLVGRVEARSTNGAIHAAFRQGNAPLEGVQLRTTNGAIRLQLPEQASAQLHLSTTNGSINTELPLQIQGRVSRRSLTGTLGSGGPEVRAATTNGSIRITGS